jgi:Tfp pilus assembly protein PilN
MFSLLLSGRIPLYIAGAVAIIGIYFFWKHNVEQIALLEYNQKQLQQVIEDQQRFQQKMQEVENKQRSIEIDLANQNDQVSKVLIPINDYLNSTDAKKQDKPASEILKKTVGGLRGNK